MDRVSARLARGHAGCRRRVPERALGVHDEPDEPDERKRQCTSKGVRRALDSGGELTEARAPEPMMSGAGNDPVLLFFPVALCKRVKM